MDAVRPDCLADIWPVDVVDQDAPGGTVADAPIAPGVIDDMRRALALVSSWGMHVAYVDGWESRGRTYATFEPAGSVNHHTGGPAHSDEAAWERMVTIVTQGRADLPGPLSQVCTWPDGRLWVVAAGTANHAGPGSWAGLSGNAAVWGNEAVHSGGPDEPWPDVQLATMLAWDVALCMVGRSSPERVCEHKEWSTAGKIDRIGIDGDEWRARVTTELARRQGQETPMTPEDLAGLRRLIALTPDLEQLCRIVIGGNTDSAGALAVWASLHHDLAELLARPAGSIAGRVTVAGTLEVSPVRG